MRKKRSPAKGPPKPPGPPGTDGVLELDRFTNTDLDRWNRLSESLDYLHNQLHYGFEAQRSPQRKELIQALQSAPACPVDFAGWCRVVAHRYSLSPLSALGSLSGVGGRFNVGKDIPSDVRASWPALYIAADAETALREKYGLTQSNIAGGLTREELALLPRESHTLVRLNGHIENVFDLTGLHSLAPFCKVIGRFKMPHGVDTILRKLHINRKKVQVVRTPNQLQRAVMSSNWRQWPVQFEVPAHGQIFASLVIAAGHEAIRYPSTKSGEHCIAVFPQNISSTLTFIELADATPPETTCLRLDIDSSPVCSGVSLS